MTTNYFFGFSLWKQKHILAFFPNQEKHIFSHSLSHALAHGLTSSAKIYIWGKKPFPQVEHYAEKEDIPLYRIEDGFIRSVSLGSDLTKAYSIVIDSRGIYFDPSQESDLEYLLNTYTFDNNILQRAKDLQHYLVQNKISKYNTYQDKKVLLEDIKYKQSVILVPGQVEDDASIVYGADNMTNLELLQQTRCNRPDAYIIYKPHPDVLSGNRKGDIASDIVLQYCNTIITKTSIDSVLALCDEVHTMTSLVGFEALIRGKNVCTYGLPFYAGWGLTTDKKQSKRRIKMRTLDELVAATLILYPKYIHPKTNTLCDIEVFIREIDKEKNRYNRNRIYQSYIDIRNIFSRKIQRIIRVIFHG